MIVYPLSKTETRIIRWVIPAACWFPLAVAGSFCLICDLIEWLEGLVPLMQIGIEA